MGGAGAQSPALHPADEHFTLRTNAEVARLFGGLEILEPGVVRVEDWRPDPGAGQRWESAMWGGVALKR